MKNPVQLTEAIPPIQDSLRPSFLQCRTLLILLVLVIAWFALSSSARASCPGGSCLNNYNTEQGGYALSSLTTGAGNTALGYEALYWNTNGSQNTVTGDYACVFNESGNQNTATGASTLVGSPTVITYLDGNTATGVGALNYAYSAAYNTATGVGTLASTDSSLNTATGAAALTKSSAFGNTATGDDALYSSTAGAYNTANGNDALFFNTEGNFSTAAGVFALSRNTTGSDNIALGESAGDNLTTGSNNIDIGNSGLAGESNTIRIGTQGTQTATVIAGISGVAVTGSQVVVNSDGQLGVTTSSARFKDEIKPMDKASEAILALKPVTFRYKKELDPDSTAQFGLVAEEVARINPDLVAHDDEGKPYTVRYEAVNAMLLNEFLKKHRKVAAQRAMLTEQDNEIQALTKLVKEQASQIQKVTAQLAAEKTGARVVANDP